MEWDSKVCSWDFSEELDQNVEHNMGNVGTSSSLGAQSGGMDCSVDLKLGGLGDFGLAEKWREQSSMPSSSSPSKKSRQPSSAGQVALCSVDGCRADLSNCRDYHRRHKVCEVHSKTPVVMVGGQEQRFCQQCSRFHSLVEFDEAKRSCRKRLDGHNRRRRKPQPESINPAVLFPHTQETRFLTFPHMLSTSLTEPNWGGIIKAEEDSTYPLQLHLDASNLQPHFASSFSQEREFPFLHDAQITFTRTGMVATTSTCQPLLETITSTERSCNKYFPDGRTQVFDSDCALSLLSPQSHSLGTSMGQILPAERIPMGQPLVSALEYSSLGQFSSSQMLGKVLSTGFSFSGGEDEQAATVLVTDSEANIHCPSVFDVGGVGSSESGSQCIPFSWQ